MYLRQVRLGEVTDNYDSLRRPVKGMERVAGEFPYYGASGIVDYVDNFIFDGDYLLIAEDGENLRSRSTPIAFMATGKFWVNNHAHVVKGNHLSDTRFLSYILAITDVSGYLTGSTQPKLTRAAMDSIQLMIPELDEQKEIVEVLGALDDKIVANTNLIATVDSLAQAQFHTALHDSQPQPLSSLASFVNGKAFTKGASGTGRVVVRIAELNSGIGKSTVFSDAEVDDKHVARPGDILFAWSGSLTLHRWFRDEAIVNQHIFKVIPNEGIPDWLIYELLRNKIEDFKMIAADKATTMGHIQRKHLDELVLVPSEVAQGEIAPLMESLWQTALTAERENLTLAATRDALLPQLMSGKLRVKDAEPALEDVL